MIYLHKSVFQSHGYLSSANCHVDSRWVLKISGFALHAFRMKTNKEQVNRCFYYVKIILLLTIACVGTRICNLQLIFRLEIMIVSAQRTYS